VRMGRDDKSYPELKKKSIGREAEGIAKDQLKGRCEICKRPEKWVS